MPVVSCQPVGTGSIERPDLPALPRKQPSRSASPGGNVIPQDGSG